MIFKEGVPKLVIVLARRGDLLGEVNSLVAAVLDGKGEIEVRY